MQSAVSVFATCDITYMHLCSCKSVEKIVPIHCPQFCYLFLIICTDSLIFFEILIHQWTIQFMRRPDPLYMTLLSGSILDFVERFSLQALKTFFRNFFNIYGYGWVTSDALKIEPNFKNDHFTTISTHFLADYMDIFYKNQIQTIILR